MTSEKIQQTSESWFVYLVRTKSNSLYCGITNDLERRFKQHCEGKGAKALRGKGPLKLVWNQSAESKSEALKIEHAIKKLSKKTKENLVAEQSSYILSSE
ncbi:GIY-YIG nuclease family protein [Vibrio maerlii]|uniref:GIY-YIG nuclease family protein n=1 Tax=Vibrio maerlii TaxID=2231648 RepID=UPI000E3C17D2|nr:GIY-YIG nuclease family protein [Vibrio maerlii]